TGGGGIFSSSHAVGGDHVHFFGRHRVGSEWAGDHGDCAVADSARRTGSGAGIEFSPIQHGAVVRPDAGGGGDCGGGSGGRIHVQRVHVCSTVDCAVLCDSAQPGAAKGETDVHLARHSRGIEICVDASGDAAADDHEFDFHVSQRTGAGITAGVCAERAARRAGTFQFHAGGHRAGLDHWRVRVVIDSGVLSAASFDSAGDVHVFGNWVGVQFFNKSFLKRGHIGGGGNILV